VSRVQGTRIAYSVCTRVTSEVYFIQICHLLGRDGKELQAKGFLLLLQQWQTRRIKEAWSKQQNICTL
jgi:hypothetical protein